VEELAMTDAITDTHYPDARRKARYQLGGGVIAAWIVGAGLAVTSAASTSIYFDAVAKAKANCVSRDYSSDPYWHSYAHCYDGTLDADTEFATVALVTGILGAAAIAFGTWLFRREPAFMRALRQRPQDVVWIYDRPVEIRRRGVHLRTTYVVCIGLVDQRVLALDMGVSASSAQAELHLVSARAPKATVGFSSDHAAAFQDDPRALLRA
jgi:hypothetical protein